MKWNGGLMNKSLAFAVLFLLVSMLCFGQKAPDPKGIEDLVNRAAALVESKGKAAFDEFRKKDSEWFYGNTYVFVDDMNGKSLCLPSNPAEEGKTNLDLKDASGKQVMKDFIDTAKKGSGWIEYVWPKPGETKPSKKKSFVRSTKMPDGQMVIVGSGMYVE